MDLQSAAIFQLQKTAAKLSTVLFCVILHRNCSIAGRVLIHGNGVRIAVASEVKERLHQNSVPARTLRYWIRAAKGRFFQQQKVTRRED